MRPHRLLLAVLFTVAACTRDTSFTAEIEDSVSLRKAVLTKVPIGTRLDSAVRILERNAFVCNRPNPTVGRPWARSCSKESAGGTGAILRQTFNINLISRDSLAGDKATLRADSIETFTRIGK